MGENVFIFHIKNVIYSPMNMENILNVSSLMFAQYISAH